MRVTLTVAVKSAVKFLPAPDPEVKDDELTVADVGGNLVRVTIKSGKRLVHG